MNILITGITGYIGSQVAATLCKEHSIYGLYREPLNDTYIAEFKNSVVLLPFDGSYSSMYAAMETANPRMVLHFATFYTGGHTPQQIDKMVSANILMGTYLLEAMNSLEVKAILYTTSSMCNYNNEEYNPINLYAATKQAFGDILKYYCQDCGASALTISLSDTYGANDLRPKILNKIKTLAENASPIEMSTGEQDLDIVYIDDVVCAIKIAISQLLQMPPSCMQTFSIGSASPLSLKATVAKLEKAMGKKLPILWGVRPQEPRQIEKSVTVFDRLPNWTAVVDLETGLQKFIK